MPSAADPPTAAVAVAGRGLGRRGRDRPGRRLGGTARGQRRHPAPHTPLPRPGTPTPQRRKAVAANAPAFSTTTPTTTSLRVAARRWGAQRPASLGRFADVERGTPAAGWPCLVAIDHLRLLAPDAPEVLRSPMPAPCHHRRGRAHPGHRAPGRPGQSPPSPGPASAVSPHAYRWGGRTAGRVMRDRLCGYATCDPADRPEVHSGVIVDLHPQETHEPAHIGTRPRTACQPGAGTASWSV